ncbi:hypothetical protein QFZ30_002464 [Arthrobacter pascens]|uniref:hypothetical protein n=1 Tax=Arthrobacter pascens TaxID=1677 RepID=UPI00278EEE51|nr:hypothetical protein [Arthrobacter pascens]MDQ0679082.1 hypothetical protein [Arthrobacter pascens]
MIKEHYDAVKALLPGTVRVHMWSVPADPVYPYVVLWGDLGEESSGGPDGDSLRDVPDLLSLRIRATYVGLNGDSLLIIARNARAALSRKTPTITGWRASPLRQAVLMDVQTDTDVTLTGGGHPIYAVDEFSLISHKL